MNKSTNFENGRLVFIINGLEHQLNINNGSFGTSTLWKGAGFLGGSSDKAPARESSFLHGTFEQTPTLQALTNHFPIDAILHYESQNNPENQVGIKVLGWGTGNSLIIAIGGN